MRASGAHLCKLVVRPALVLLALMATPASAKEPPPALRAAVDSLVALLVDENAREVPGSRSSQPVALADRHVFVTTFDVSGLHGGHGGGTLLAVHESNDVGERSQGADAPRSLRLVAVAWVAHRDWRTLRPAELRVEGIQLVLPGLAWQPGDASCCPSQPIEARYALEHDNLVAR